MADRIPHVLKHRARLLPDEIHFCISPGYSGIFRRSRVRQGGDDLVRVHASKENALVLCHQSYESFCPREYLERCQPRNTIPMEP